MPQRAWCLILALAASAAAPADRARDLARDAWVTIRDHPFEMTVIEEAAKHLDEAMQLNKNEPYVWLGTAELIMNGGFGPGAAFSAEAYAPGTLEKALPVIQHAVKLDPKLADAHASLAYVLILLRKYPEARTEIDAARQLDPGGFRTNLYDAVWHWKQGNTASSREALKRATAVGTSPAEQRRILYLLESQAIERGDDVQEEKLLKLIVAVDPNDPWSHGNYGWFLIGKERYDEAVAEFQRAIAIAPYPLAEQGLHRAIELRDRVRARQ